MSSMPLTEGQIVPTKLHLQERKPSENALKKVTKEKEEGGERGGRGLV